MQKGKLIERAENWKGRGYTGYVFSTPVTMDGGTVYVGAVVLETSKNRFYLHEVVDSEGHIIKINSEGTPNPTGLTSVDATGGIPSQNTELSSVESVLSSNSLSENRETVNSSLQTRGDGAVRERDFSENIRTDANRKSSLRDAVEASPDMYRQLSNKQTIEQAQAIFDKGFAEVRSEVEQALGAAKAGQKLKPIAMQICNVYRSRLIGQKMQDAGITVIPTLSWSDERSYDFCFDGLQQGGTVSVSTIGIKRDEDAAAIWVSGMNEAINRLKPKCVVVYGGDIGYEFPCKTVYIANHNSERFRDVDIN